MRSALSLSHHAPSSFPHLCIGLDTLGLGALVARDHPRAYSLYDFESALTLRRHGLNACMIGRTLLSLRPHVTRRGDLPHSLPLPIKDARSSASPDLLSSHYTRRKSAHGRRVERDRVPSQTEYQRWASVHIRCYISTLQRPRPSLPEGSIIVTQSSVRLFTTHHRAFPFGT